MGRLVITTCGTSLLEKIDEDIYDYFNNHNDEDEIKKAEQNLNSYLDFHNRALRYLEGINEKEVRAKEIVGKKFKPDLKEYSAEIASLKLMNLTKDDEVLLFYSDTPDGAFCALVNEAYIKDTMGISCTKQKIDGLEAGQLSGAVKELINKIDFAISHADGKEPIFNITGGYKGVIPFITIMAQRKRKDIFYLYQDSTAVTFTHNFRLETFDTKTNESSFDNLEDQMRNFE